MAVEQDEVEELVQGMLREHPIAIPKNASLILTKAYQDGDTKTIVEELATEHRYQFGVLSKEAGILYDWCGPDSIQYISKQFDEITESITEGWPENKCVPFYIDTGIADIGTRLAYSLRASNSVAPILAVLPLINHPEKIPPEAEYDDLRNTLKDLGASFFRVHCPDDPALEETLNKRLDPARKQSLASSLYLQYYDRASSWAEIFASPFLGGIVGAGASYGVDEIHNHIKSTNIAGLVDGIDYTLAEIADSILVAMSQIRQDYEHGASRQKLIREYGRSAVLGALSGDPFNTLGGEVYTHHGELGHLTGGAILALMNSLGVAANAKKGQDRLTEAYIELLEKKRIPPSERIAQLRDEIEALSSDEIKMKEKQIADLRSSIKTLSSDEINRSTRIAELRIVDLRSNIRMVPESEIGIREKQIADLRDNIETLSSDERKMKVKQLKKAVKKYATTLARLEYAAGLPNRKANLAMVLSPLTTFTPGAHVQAAVLGGAENYIIMLQNLLGRPGRSYEERKVVEPLEQGDEPDLMKLAAGRLRSAELSHRAANRMGHVARAPEIVGKGIKNMPHATATAGHHVANLARRKTRAEQTDPDQEKEIGEGREEEIEDGRGRER